MTTKPLIVHVLYRLDTGGMERILVSLVNGTSDRYRHAVITLNGFGAIRAEIAEVVTECLSLEKKPGKDWPCYFRFWRALRSLKPDLVQTYNIGTLDLAPVAKLAGVGRLVHAEHGRDAADPRGERLKYHRLRRWLAPLIGRYVAVSTDLQHWLVDQVRIKQSKVTYIPNGIETAQFNTSGRSIEVRKLLGDFAPAGTLLIGHVARLDLVKDQAGLITAFKLLQDGVVGKSVSCRLVIVGDGPQRASLERQIEKLGLKESVRLLGNRHDVALLLAECDVFALSSVAEGMPVTLLEAMASGLPLVATHVGGIASVVENGVTGTLVPASDPHKLAEAMAVYISDKQLRRQHGRAGRARVAARFESSTMVAGYVALYDELLGRPNDAMQARVVSGVNWHEEN